MSWRGLSKRRMSPISVAKVTATITSTPRSACNACTIGASDQPCKNSSIAASSRSTISFEIRTASTISCNAI